MIIDKFLDRLRPREKLGLLIAVLCIFALLADHLVVAAVVKKMRQIDDETKTAKKMLVYNIGVLERGVPKDYDGIGNVLEKSGSSGEIINEMKDEIYDIAHKTGVELPSMEGRDPVKKDFYEVYPVEIGKFDTTMENLINFLHALHTSPSMLIVSRLSISSSKESNQNKVTMLVTKLIMQTSPPPSLSAPPETKKQDKGISK